MRGLYAAECSLQVAAAGHAEFAIAFLRLAKEAELHTAVETSGFAEQFVLEPFVPLVDLWLFDVKHLDPARFQNLVSQPLAPVLDNLRRLDAVGRPIVLRLPLVPGLNDEEDELAAIGRLADATQSVKRLEVEPYDNLGVGKAHRLGVSVYGSERPEPAYGEEMVRKISFFTGKPVVLS